jgi:hypothetical protein
MLLARRIQEGVRLAGAAEWGERGQLVSSFVSSEMESETWKKK